MQIEIERAMELIYNIIHEQSESLTSEQLEALNLGLSALKTIEDMKLKSASLYGSNVSRETILGRKLIELAGYNCAGMSCTGCSYYDKANNSCLPLCACYIVNLLERR